MTRALAIALAALAAGCSPLIGFLIRAGRSESAEIRAGETVTGSTRGASDDFTPSCGAPDGAGDRAYAFVPPASATYRIELDATYDCVLALVDEQGNAIECNDDAGSTTHSALEPRLEAGRRYTVVVDGYRANSGDFTLRVSEPIGATPTDVPPPAGDVLVLDVRATGTTTGRADTRTPPCGAAPGSPDQTWLFTAPSAGHYTIDVDSDFDGVLAVYAPGAAEPLACNDDHGSTRASRVEVDLGAGQAVEVVIDGYRGGQGSYDVVVRGGGGSGPPASGQPLVLGTPTRGDTTRGADQHQPECGSRPGTRDETWLFTPPITGAYMIHVDAEFDSVLAIYERGAPQPLHCNDDFGSTRRSRLTTRLEAGREYEVVVDGYGTYEGAYMVTVTPVTSTGGGTIAVGPIVSGDTSAGSDHHTPSCGSQAGTPDEVWSLPVPASGQYVIHVDAEYDSLLAIYGANGAELACNDDYGGTRASRIETTLNGGDTVQVVVDGFQGASGSYRLRVIAASGAAPPTPTPTPQPGPPPPPELAVEDITRVEARCATAPALAPGLTAGRVSAAEAAARTTCGGGAGGEAMYTVTAPVASTLTVRAESTLPPVLELRTACSRGHSVVACEAAANEPQRATLTARLEAGRTYTLIVDTQRAGDATFTLEVAIEPVVAP